jgi:hypothetical protein
MIPKYTFANLYLELYQAKIKKGGRTIRGNGPDRPAAPGGLFARAVRTVRARPAPVGPRLWDENCMTPSNPTQDSILSLSCSLSKKNLHTLELLIQALPGPSEHIPGLFARFSTMSSGYFFAYLILSLGF